MVFDGFQTWKNGILVLSEEGQVMDLLPEGSLHDDVKYLPHGWLCPGFINVHGHLELSHLKGQIEEGIGMTGFLLKVMYGRNADKEFALHCIQSAEEQMVGHGIVAAGDICNTADTLSCKSNSTLHWHNFIEVTGFVPATAKQRFDLGMDLLHRFKTHLPQQPVSIVPHAPYSVSPKLFELIQNHPQAVVCMHNQESDAEEQFLTQKTGDLLRLYESIGIGIDFFRPENTSSLQYSAPMLPLASQVILVHNCHTQEQDIRYLHDTYERIQSSFSFCLCPNANLYIGNPLPNVAMLRQWNENICIGTDSLASNKQLSILAELQTLQAHFPELDLVTLLAWATSHGARALCINEQFGSFGKGMRPGVLWLENLDREEKLLNASVQRLY
jgi:cytosine/adenosine deaminase-related metal-dependent hydrolase